MSKTNYFLKNMMNLKNVYTNRNHKISVRTSDSKRGDVTTNVCAELSSIP